MALLLPGLLGMDNLTSRLLDEPLRVELHDRDTIVGGLVESGEYGVAEFSKKMSIVFFFCTLFLFLGIIVDLIFF